MFGMIEKNNIFCLVQTDGNKIRFPTEVIFSSYGSNLNNSTLQNLGFLRVLFEDHNY